MVEINKSILEALEQSSNKLSTEAVNQIKKYIKSQLHPNGGFIGRSGKPDPYYSVFGYTLSFVFGLELDIEKQQSYISTWADTNTPDFVHAVSLVRCYQLVLANKYKSKMGELSKHISLSGFLYNQIKKKISKKVVQENGPLLKIIETYRSKDKGYNHNSTGTDKASIYATFLAWGLYQDLNRVNDEPGMQQCIQGLCKPDGSYVNDHKSETGVTTATAAGLIMSLLQQNTAKEKSILWLQSKWMLRGGFVAAEGASIADLLSTSTALLALKQAGVPMRLYADDCEEFIGLHWDSSGGFFGSAADMFPDCEYTYYALLALGLL